MPFKPKNTKASKLTGEKVLEIREKAEYEGYTRARLAREYQVCIGTINNIVNGVTWQNAALLPEMIERKQEARREAAQKSFERFQALSEKPKEIPPNPMFSKPADEDKFGRPDLAAKLMGEVNEVRRKDEELENFEKGESDESGNV